MNRFSSLITGIQHIGIPTSNVLQTIAFYESLGFSTKWTSDNKNVAFLELGNCVIEAYYSDEPALKSGAIDHISLNVTDVESVFTQIKAANFTMLDEEINFLPFLNNGVRFFTIQGPNMEKIEFNQILKEKTT